MRIAESFQRRRSRSLRPPHTLHTTPDFSLLLLLSIITAIIDMSAGPSSSVGQAIQNVAHAAEEFMDQMNTTQEEGGEEEDTSAGADGGDNTVESRKKKLEQLRQRMVRRHL